MNVLVYLVPMALGFGLIGLFAFLWALRKETTGLVRQRHRFEIRWQHDLQ